MRIGSNSQGPHPASIERPVQHPEWDKPSPGGYVVSNHMINEPPPNKPFRIIVMGAGAAGIDFLHFAPSAFAGLGVEYVCYDKNLDVGGTWYENRYPGCACDVPSVGYTFPWKANPRWTSFYSTSQEIWAYMKEIVEEEGMMKHIQLRTEIKSAIWDEDKSKWVVKLSKSGTDASPTESFKGVIHHTAAYPEGLDLKGKRVAVIGSGSSGVQVVASIYPEVSKLYTWVRSPTWITAAFGQQFAGENGRNFDYTESQKDAFARDPKMYHRYKKMIETELNKRFRLVLRNTRESDEANAFAYKEMATKLSPKTDLIDVIIPKDFNVACRRPTPGNGYLEALAGDKTEVFTQSIGGITEKGVIDSATEQEYEVDVIICATGFDTSYRPRFPIVGLDPKVPLSVKWADHPSSYLGVGVDGFPNYVTYSGPSIPVAQGSVLPIISLLTKHFVELIQKMRSQHIRRLSPKASAVRDFTEHSNTFMPRTCWADPCTSWFKQGTKDGPIIMWPGTRLAYFDVMKHPNFEDYDIEYWSGNRFGFLGTGFVDYEFTGSEDNAWYLDTLSDHKEWEKGVACGHDEDELKLVNKGQVPASAASFLRNGTT
ncbi:unnamed protein product [Parascedosporium putredinis]|uniref:Flavin-binding monooxygenase n=1 Tax=Parascedosporium putredinis TaxID=1442378 RepID=A0A9P1H4N1_9PEZI|nr:unnamed protein product [Parascedosporium putredinis]CAI7996831.1 unnamed protein product [Parascedosporium putredinis]